MKILITGAAGFIGSNFADYFLKNDYEVVAVDNFNDFYSPKIKEFNISEFKDHPNFKLYRVDISDRAALEPVFSENTDIDAVVHLAAWAGVTQSVENPHQYVKDNVLGTNNLTDFCIKYGINNFIFASTSSVYGDNPTPFTEDMNTSFPNAPYPATKKSSEVLLYTINKNQDLNVTIFRFFNPLGPRMRPDLALPKLVKSVEYGKVFELWQDPTSSARDYTYIDDMARAVEAVIKEPQDFVIMNLGNSNPISLQDMIETVEEVTGKSVTTTENYLPGQMKETFADISRARDLIGYDPKTTLKEMVEFYYNWFLQQPEWYRKDDY
ncbi:NAD-dependent epimerase/dehydratase family protein [candidate division WWE3 bacterium]|nr:NAD-dependent epimerase/dehydratase family protein [candidate division WWE3 bacterium]